MRITKKIILLLFFLAIIIVFIIPFKIPFAFKATARIYPSQEWVLMAGQDDSFVSVIYDNKTNVVNNLINYKFERGDIAELQINPLLVSGQQINKGDSIAYIHSYEIENELAKLQSELQVEQASLDVVATGEKESIIKEAERKYDYAKQQLKLDEKTFLRQQALFQDSVISAAEFDQAENAYQLAKINLNILENELLSLKSGDKPSEINLTNERINSIKNNLEILENQKDQYFINSPKSGIINFSPVLGQYFSISDNNEYILEIAVQLKNRRYLDSLSSINFAIDGDYKTNTASLLQINPKVESIGSHQVFFMKALADNNENISRGMAVQCKIACDDVSLFEYCMRTLDFVY